MTLRKLAILAMALPGIVGFIACNSEYESNIMTASSTAIKSFSLTKDDSVVAHLDSVFFSIDLNKGLIFNADSLPYGTDVSKLIPVITTLETASAVTLTVTRTNGTDTTFNYLSNSTDTIDFTNPVKLRVVSYDGLKSSDYTVYVNVHKMVSDSLTWVENNKSALPTNLGTPAAQHTVTYNGSYYCMTTDGTTYNLSEYTPTTDVTNGPGMQLDRWNTGSIEFPFIPQVESFAATDDAFYILSDDGTLYTSSDMGRTWESTSKTWHYIYGKYGDEILGSVQSPNGWYVEGYPSGKQIKLPEEMPVEATSMPVSYTFPMSGIEQIVIVGGKMANGDLSAQTWGYDGTSWAAIAKRQLPERLENIAVGMYFSFKTLSSWNTITYPTLLAIGGKNSEGIVSPKVYISNDYGVNWAEASDEMQLPEYISPVFGAQIFVVDSYFSSTIQPKVVKPIETWACPYIYLMGGYDSNNSFQNVIWRGVINRLSFKPIE